MKSGTDKDETVNEKEEQANEVEKENYGTIVLQGDIDNYNSVPITKESSYWDMYKGMIFMVFSCLGFTGISFFSKILLIVKPEITSYEVLTIRTYLLFILASLCCFVNGTNIFAEENIRLSKLPHIITRSVLATITISLLIYSIKFIDASDVYTIFYCYPALVVILGFIFTRDSPKLLDYLCLACCFIGVLFVVRPEFLFGEDLSHHGANHKKQSTKTFYFVLSFLAALTKSTEVVLVRDIGNDIHFLVFPLFFSFFGLVMFPIPMLISGKYSFIYTPTELGLICLISLSSWCYHAFLALSLQSENAGRASMINYLQIPILLIADLFLFGKEPNFPDIFGSLLIFTFNFSNGIYKALDRIEKLDNLKLDQNDNKDKSGDPILIEEHSEIIDNYDVKEDLPATKPVNRKATY